MFEVKIKQHFLEVGEWILMHNCSAAAAKLLESCLTLCDPIDSSPPGSPVPGILQARILEWVAISFSNAWKWKVKMKSLSHVWLLATPWTTDYQASPSMGFSRQKYWSGVLAWLAAIHGIAKSRTWLSDWTELNRPSQSYSCFCGCGKSL